MDKSYVLGLPAKYFTNILASDDLNIKSESDLIELIREYFDRHKSTTPNAPVKPEDQAGPHVWGLLNDAERKTRTDAYNKQVTEKATKEQATLDLDSKQYFALTDQKKKDQHLLTRAWKKVYDEVKARLSPIIVTETDKISIFKAVRWSRLTHE